MSARKYKVYCHTNKANNKKYIGITNCTNPEDRWRKGNGYDRQLFGKVVKECGWDNFEHEILYEDLTEEEAKQIETELIKEYKTFDAKYGYNLVGGGSILQVSTHKVEEYVEILETIKQVKEIINDIEEKVEKLIDKKSKLGRPQKDKDVMDTAIEMWLSREYSIREICNVANCSKQTLYNRLHERDLM